LTCKRIARNPGDEHLRMRPEDEVAQQTGAAYGNSDVARDHDIGGIVVDQSLVGEPAHLPAGTKDRNELPGKPIRLDGNGGDSTRLPDPHVMDKRRQLTIQCPAADTDPDSGPTSRQRLH